jgi:opacity protein-like surface antigen
VATAVALSFALPAMADDTGFYIGANAGRVLSTYKRKDLDSASYDAFGGANQQVAFSPPSALDKTHVMWSANVGYMLNPNFGLEASFIHLGSLTYTAYGTNVNSFTGSSQNFSLKLDLKSQGPALAAVGVLPMTNFWQLDARVGAYQGKTTTTFLTAIDGTPNPGKESKTSTSVLLGVGTAITLTNHLVARIDYMRLQGVDEKVFDKSFNVDLVTAGVAFVF